MSLRLLLSCRRLALPLLGLASGLAPRLASAVPLEAVTDLQVEVLASGSLRLDWSDPLDALGRPLLAPTYELHGSSRPWFQPGPATLLLESSQTEALLEQPDSLAFFRVVARAVTRPALTALPAGSFEMGQAAVAIPVHPVTLTHDFLLGRCEISNQEFLEVANWALEQGLASLSASALSAYGVNLLDLGSAYYSELAAQDGRLVLRQANGAAANGYAQPYDPADHPLKMVSWYGAACYCDWLSLLAGLPPYYEGQWEQIPGSRNPYLAQGYRLPTEAEWERASGRDAAHPFAWGAEPLSCERANYMSSNGYCVGWTLPVGSLPAGATATGLLDMGGNVREWCNDRYVVYPATPQTDPVGPPTGNFRIARSGAWSTSAGDEMAAARHVNSPASHTAIHGFRIARTMPAEP